MMIVNNKVIGIVLLVSVMSGSAMAGKHEKNNKGHHEKPSFSSIDENGDGLIAFEEFSLLTLPRGDHKTVFSDIDSDNNNEISEEELNNHKPPQKRKAKERRHD
jgi:hypothetical protein